MKKHFLLFVFLSTATQITFAAKIRVDNNPGNPGQYTTAQAAHDAATAGDTLYFTGSALSYGDLTATKRLIYIGPGYFLSQNPKTQANIQTAKFGDITFNSGSAGSLFTGMEIGQYNSFTGHIVINDNNIMIKRCCSYQGLGTGYIIRIRSNKANVSILGCYLQNTQDNGCATNYADPDNVLLVDSNCTNISIKGNLIFTVITCSNASISIHQTSYCEFANNVFTGRIFISNSMIYNNFLASNTDIIVNGVANGYYNNIAVNSAFGTANGNQNNVSVGSTFESSGSYDGYWKLTTGSPALGAGYPAGSGYDIGAFSGTDPYVLSGIPAVPHIYEFTAPSTGSAPNGLPVTIKVKSQN